MILRLGYLWWRMREVRRFLAAADRCQEVQREVLFQRVRRNAESHFGRDHGFAEIHSLADFRRRVPLTTYEYYLPYIDRVKRGHPEAMFGPGTELLMFALTSGTTADPKFIPVTREFYREYRDGWNLWGLGTFADHMDLLYKKTLGLASNWRQFYTEGGTPCGNISGLVTETASRLSRFAFLVPWTLIGISDPVARQYTALRLALASRRVGMLMTANASTLIILAGLADTRRESLIRDLYDGTLAPDIEVPDGIRKALRRRLRRPARHRARELEAIVRRTGHLYPRDFWPRMSLLAVWLGSSAGAYVPRLKEYYGDLPLRDHGLSASEGRMTIPMEDNTNAGLLEFTHHFFEFIPEEEHGRPQPTTLEAHELEIGKSYFIILTTSSGLYRYDIHDLVRCVGYRGTAPQLEFLNKGLAFSNITGEKLSEFQVVSAAKEAFDELGLPVDTYTLAPRFDDLPCYVLLIEPDPSGRDRSGLAQCLDRRLRRWNCEYANRRETGRLAPLAIGEIPPGTWTAFHEDRIRRTRGNLEQYKHPCLAGDLRFIEELRTFYGSQRVQKAIGSG
jgi:hypothetical protein